MTKIARKPIPARTEKAGTSMPTPTGFAAAGSDSNTAQGRVMPGASPMSQSGEMPRPSQTSSGATSMPTPGSSTSAGMPLPSFSGNTMSPSSLDPTAGGSQLPRFGPIDITPGKRPPAQFEPGVVEVQFREGVVPTVAAQGLEGPVQIRSAADIGLDQVNTVLRRYQLVKAEPTFLTSHEEATTAQATARAQGIEAPLLSHFVTLHFPEETNIQEVANELNKLPEVERAVPVPVALPPSLAIAVPPESELELEAAAPELPPVGNPLAEPLVGTTDQVVLNPVTGLENQWYIFRCRANTAWNKASGNNVVIADVDWGCRTSHQDLAPNIERTYNSFDGTTDVTHGSSVFHGTGVAGHAGAAVNSKGMAGFAYQARLWPIQADSGTGTSLGGNAWARGIDYVRTTDSGGRRKIVILEVQTGAFGNYEQVPSVNTAIKTAIASGVIVCVAAGNGNRDAGIDDSGNPIPETGSILVGATAYNATQNVRAGFSNYGPRIVVCAPGDSAHDLTCDNASDTAYRNGFGGTSGATPKVAGTAGLILSINPSLTHAQVRQILNSTGSAVVTDPGKPVGTFLNADAAVKQATVGAVGRLEVFVSGADHAVWHMWQTAPNNGWSGWASLGGWVDIIKSARNADGHLEMFVRGADHAVWHMWQTAPNNGWSGWASLGGWVDRIALGKNADGRLEVFVRGSDGAVWHNWQTAPNNGWSGWASLGGWVSDIAVGQNADGRLELFVIGSDHALWHNWQTAPNNGWSGWASMGGWIDMLDVGRNADGRLEVFARGADGAVWHNWQTAPNNGWSGWASRGGWVDNLVVKSNADGRLEVFVRGADRALWHQWQTAPNNGWSGWGSLGGWIDRLTVNQNADGRLEIFARGADNALWHNWQVAPNNGWNGWASLGGWIDILDVDQNAA
jgi:subtilisin family serine protease